MPLILQSATAQNSSESYESLLKCRIVGRPRATVTITNSHAANALKYKILVSNDAQGVTGSFAEDKGETSLAPLSSERYVLSGPFAWVDIVIIDASVGDHAVGNGFLMACGV